MRKLVLLSPYFPPSTLAGVHRARHLAKHLPNFGWRPIVVCVHEAYHSERLDPDLAKLVPPNTVVVKCRAASARVTGFAAIGDISLRAWRPLGRTLLDVLTRYRPEGVLITGSPYYPMLFAKNIKKLFRVPVVLDFQDPWVSAWGAAQPVFTKAWLSHRLATLLEPRVLRAADYVTSVSETQNAELVARYPWFDATRMAAIPIGGDPDDFAALLTLGAGQNEIDPEPGRITLSYVGTILPRSGPLFRALFRGFSWLRASEPELAARIRFLFVGTSNQPNGGPLRAMLIAEAEGVAENIREIPERVPYLAAVGVLARSQGLLLIGSEEPHYTASKIYPALMAGRPFVSLFHRASSAHSILSKAGGGKAFAFESPEELASLVPPLANALRTLALCPESFGKADPGAYAPYTASAVARRFADIFNRLER